MPLPTSGNFTSIPKWQIALGLGAVGAIGLTLWYFRQQQQSDHHNKTGRKSLEKDISIDGDSGKTNKQNNVVELKKQLTPLEQAQEYKTKGNTLFKNGKYDEAINFYNLAIEICPNDNKTELSTYYQNRAACYENLKNYEMVIKDCTSAIELNQRYEKALMRRAKIYEILKDWENCLDDITSVCLLQQFQNQTALLMADRVLKELGKHHAQEEMKQKQPVMPSKTFIKTYFASFSEDIVHQKLLDTTTGEQLLGQGELKGFQKAKLAFATEKYDEIIQACTEEINTSESESSYKIEAFALRASFYFLTGQFDKAVDDLTTIINNDIADKRIRINALIKRASIQMQQEKLQECLDDFDRAAELGPEISDVYHHRGQVKLLLERTKEAVDDFHKAVELNPNFPIAYVQKCYSDYRLAMQQQNVDRLMASMNDFRQSLEKFPNCMETYILYGQVLTEKQDFQKAEKYYKKALELDPQNASIYVHYGLLYLQWKGDIEEAVKLMKQAIQVDDKSEFAYETLGTVEVQRGNLLVAIELFDKAIKLAKTEMEMTHLFSLRDAAMSQLKVTNRLGINMHLINKV